MRNLVIVFALVVGLALGVLFGESLRSAGSQVVATAVGAVVEVPMGGARGRVLEENPEIMLAIARGGGFGGKTDPLVALNMFSRAPEPIAKATELTEIIEVAPRTWLLRFPVVNAAVFETDEGLVIVDTGMAPAGPAMVDAIRSVSDAPVHTVIYTHGHVDHAYGTWALLEAGETPEIVAHEKLPARFERYIRLRGSLAHYMSQPEDQLPAKREDLVWPTRTFSDRLELEIGGETFVLVHHEGETDDQLYVWVPGRKTLASADYYQGFLPNAGNGKRVQRNVGAWAGAMREMADLQPELLVPAHGAAITDPAEIRESFLVLAEVLEYIRAETLEGLNAGLRKDQVFQSIELPPRLADHPTMNVQYVTAKDISKMVIKRYTGWWDDLPSHWTPAPLEAEAATLVRLAGGMEALAAEARALVRDDIRLACHLADWAFLADPGDATAQQLILDVYKARIIDPASNTQEILAYLDHMADARARQLAAGS